MKQYLHWWLGVVCVAILTNTVLAAVYQEGKEYELVTPPQPTTTGDKIEILELFWYGCPHCYKFEPYIQRWLKKKPAHVEFVRLPAILPPRWAFLARAFYTAQVLGVLDKINEPLFAAIHELKRSLDNEQALAGFFAEHGVAQQDFHRVFRSFAVDSKVRRAMDLSRRYGVRGVPSVIVNGKYRTSPGQAGGAANVLKVIDFLIKKERSGTKK